MTSAEIPVPCPDAVNDPGGRDVFQGGGRARLPLRHRGGEALWETWQARDIDSAWSDFWSGQGERLGTRQGWTTHPQGQSPMPRSLKGSWVEGVPHLRPGTLRCPVPLLSLAPSPQVVPEPGSGERQRDAVEQAGQVRVAGGWVCPGLPPPPTPLLRLDLLRLLWLLGLGLFCTGQCLPGVATWEGHPWQPSPAHEPVPPGSLTRTSMRSSSSTSPSSSSSSPSAAASCSTRGGCLAAGLDTVPSCSL